jgi:tetratricopeptide (TPR) repeat protein
MRRDLFNRFGVLLISALFFCLIYSNLFAAEVISETATLLETAKKAWEAGDLETSGNLYRKIITDSPSTIEAIIAYQDLAIQGIQSKRSADVESFVETLKVKYAKFPETADALHSVAQHYQWNGQPEQAINLYRYNSSTYTDTKKGMWSQGAIVHYYIEHKDFTNAQKEIEVMLERFKEQPTLPQEIHQFAEKYRTTGESDRALELHKFNATHSPISSVYTMWSRGGMVHHYIRQKDFVSAKQACDTMIERFKEQPTLPQELHLIAEMYKGAGKIDMALELHQFNASHSPVSSMYTMQSQGALIHYYIEQKDFYPAEYEYNNLLSRFKDQPTLPYEIYQYALKYNSVGNSEKALQLHRYNSEHSPASSLYAMQSQGSIVHYYIEHKDFVNAQKEYEVILDRFKDQENLPDEIYQFALKYNGVGQIEKALELHRYNAMYSSVSSKHSIWSQGALVHYYIEHKDLAKAQSEYETMLEHFKDQPSLPHEICLVADKYQQFGQYELSQEICQYGLETYSDRSQRQDFYKGLIKAYLAQKNYEQASLASTEFISESSERSIYVKTMLDLGQIYRENRQWEQSIQYYQQALEKAESKEERINANTGVAQVSVWLGNDTKVQDAVNLLLSEYGQEKNLSHSMFVIGEEYYSSAFTDNTFARINPDKKDNLYKAIQVWKNNVDFPDDAIFKKDTYFFIGMAYMYAEDYPTAVKWYEDIVQQWPDFGMNGNIIRITGICYAAIAEKGGEYSKEALLKAEECWSRVINQYPDAKLSYDAGVRLAKLKESKEQWNEVIDAYMFYLSRCGKDSRKNHVTFKLGWAYEQSGQTDLAYAAYCDYLQNAPAGDKYITSVAKGLLRLEGAQK